MSSRALLTSVFLVAAAACGSRAVAPAQPPADPVPDEAEAAPPVEEAPPASPPVTVFDRLRDVDGPVRGLEAYRVTLTPDPRYCGGVNASVAREASSPVSAEDAPFAAFLEVRYPDGLDFSPQTQSQSTQRFKEWLATFNRLSRAALDHYLAQRSSPDPRLRAIATARITQVAFRTASGLLRVQMPRDVVANEFSLDKKAPFCDKLREAAEPYLAYAETAARECAVAVASAPNGWWSGVCGPR
jgi:hypothetical protein